MAGAVKPAQSGADQLRLPPHSLEAEQAVLGGLMLDNSTWDQVADRLTEEDFYRQDHRLIYAAIRELAEHNNPCDAVTLAERLETGHTLDEAGGLAYLVALAKDTPSAANVRAYADIVRERSVLRQLIRIGGEIADAGFNPERRGVSELIDEAERRVFEIAEQGNRTKKGFVGIRHLLSQAVDRIDTLFHSDSALTGTSTGLQELDQKTAGLQAGDLVIVAGRPSMGKCLAYDSEIALADGSIATIEALYQRKHADLSTLRPDWRFDTVSPSAYVDDGIKPVYRVTTRLGRRIETTLTHPFLTIEGWRPLGELQAGAHIAVPRALPIFGDEPVAEHEAILLGYFLGDGSLGGNCPAFTNGAPDVQADFAQAVRAFGDLRVVSQDSCGTRTPTLYVLVNRSGWENSRRQFGMELRAALVARRATGRSLAAALGAAPSAVSHWLNGVSAPSPEMQLKLIAWLGSEASLLLAQALRSLRAQNSLRAWLSALGIWGCNAHTKFVPEAVFRWRREGITLFLNRLFTTDGWASVLASGQAQLGYCTVSERLARQVQHLLLRFGVIASLKRRRIRYGDDNRQAWQLDITDAKSIRTFAEEIGIFGKERALKKALAAIAAKRYQTNRDLIPRQVWRVIEKSKGDEPWSHLARRAGLKGFTNIHAHKRALSRARLAALAEALDDAELQAIAHSDVYWDEVSEIEYVGHKQVYDLTIPSTHNFVANDVCVHNTSFAMNIAEHAAIRDKVPTAVFSMEMSGEQLAMRMISSLGRIDQSKVRTGRLDDEDWPRITSAVTLMSEAPLFIDDAGALTPADIRARARRLKREHGIGLILIDYLQLMRIAGTRENRATEISEISRNLKALAKELGVPIIALSQLNRNLEQRPNKRPVMSDLRESGSIEQDADLIVFIYRDEVYNEDSLEKGTAEIIIGKQRNGPVGMVRATFLDRYTRFENYIPDRFDDD
jgi:replicative DNA helicase